MTTSTHFTQAIRPELSIHDLERIQQRLTTHDADRFCTLSNLILSGEDMTCRFTEEPDLLTITLATARKFKRDLVTLLAMANKSIDRLTLMDQQIGAEVAA